MRQEGLLEMFLRHGLTLSQALDAACYSGNKEVLEFVLQRGCTKWNVGLTGAMQGNQMEIVELMVSKVNY